MSDDRFEEIGPPGLEPLFTPPPTPKALEDKILGKPVKRPAWVMPVRQVPAGTPLLPRSPRSMLRDKQPRIGKPSLALSDEAKEILRAARDELGAHPAWMHVASYSTTIEWLVHYWHSQGEAVMSRFKPETRGRGRPPVMEGRNPVMWAKAIDVDHKADKMTLEDKERSFRKKIQEEATNERRAASGRESHLRKRIAALEARIKELDKPTPGE